MSARVICYWVLFAATLMVYLAMVAWTLPQIAAEAGNQQPFDLRLGGYSFDEASAFLAALTPEGRALYLGAQHNLDMFYPAMMALVLLFPLVRFTQNWPAVARFLAVIILFGGAAADYVENALVAKMLHIGAEGLTVSAVKTASFWTLTKSVCTTVAFLVLLVAMALALVSRLGRGGGGT